MNPMDAHLRTPERIQWSEIEPGVDYATLAGSPDQIGEFYAIRYRTHRELLVAPHWHPQDEHITVLAGLYAIGFGERYEAAALRYCEPSSYVLVPGTVRHFALYGAGTIVQVTGRGPFQTIYLN